MRYTLQWDGHPKFRAHQRCIAVEEGGSEAVVYMAYEYDVFISYPRKRYRDWVHNHLYRFLDLYLEDALQNVPKIFIDSQIETGESWPDALQEAMGVSKCMVCVWSPSYFESDWCLFECLTMLQRSQDTKGNPKLVLPVNISDGDGFPDYAKTIQWLDCRDFLLEGQAFIASPDYLEFQKMIRRWCTEVAEAIQAAPRWQRKWLSRQELILPKRPRPIVPSPFME